jgi:photosystem II stability/assembly factor-like uncharacterized protein
MKTIVTAISFMLMTAIPLTVRGAISEATIQIRPLPTGEQLNSVCYSSNDVLLCAGKNGTIIRRSEAGTPWKVCNSGTKYDLNSIDFCDKYMGFAVGMNGTIIRTTNSGFTWLSCRSKTGKELFAVKFVDCASAFACGLGGTILKTTDCGNYWSRIQTNSNDPMFCMDFSDIRFGCTGSFNSVYVTSDSGKTWSKKQFNFIPSAQITGICRIDSLTIYASANPLHGRFIKSTDGGESWLESSLNLPLLYGGAVDLVRDVHFKDKFLGMIVTEFGTILKTHDGGISWTRDSSFRPPNEKASVMRNITANSDHTIICGGGGTIFESNNNRKSWHISNGGLNSINALHLINETSWLIGGEGKEIYVTNDAGLNWNLTGNTNSENTLSLFFENMNTGFAATASGIEKTTDGGITWQAIHKLPVKIFSIIRVSNGMFAAGGLPEDGTSAILRSLDSGVTWANSYSGNEGCVTDISVTSGSHIFASTTFGRVLTSSDSGKNWNVSYATDERINCIIFKNELTGFAGSPDGIVLKTTDGGKFWKMIFTGRSRDINSMCIHDKSLLAVGEEGFVIRSTDEGETWYILSKVTSNNLNKVITNNHGKIFCFGNYGTVISYELQDINIFTQTKEIDELNSIVVSVSPNPLRTVTKLVLEVESVLNEFYEAELFDTAGRRVDAAFGKEVIEGKPVMTLNASHLGTGIYFCRITAGSKSAYVKLAKVK